MVTHNAGVDSYGVAQSVLLAGELTGIIQPDAIVLNLYLGNDLLDDTRFTHMASISAHAEDARIEAETIVEQRQRRSGVIARYSRLYAYGLVLWGLYADDSVMVEILVDELFLLTDPVRQAQLLTNTQDALRDFVEMCKALDARCMVSMIPPAYLVHTERLPATLRVAGLQGATMHDDELVDSLEQVLPLSVPVVDLRAPLRDAAASGGTVYLTFDAHWSADGHQVAAQAQVDVLADLLGRRSRSSVDSLHP